MADLIRLEFSAVRVGEPLPWSVYDETGRLLLSKDCTVDNVAQLQSLIDRGAYREEGTDVPKTQEEQRAQYQRPVSPFTEIEELCELLNLANQAIVRSEPEGVTRVQRLSARIMTMCEKNPDACLAAIHLHADSIEPIQHSIYYAVLAYLVAQHLEFDRDRLQSLLCIALTANIALQRYQTQLNQYRGQLTDKQRELVQRHPQQAVDVLKRAGVSDTLWLDGVLQHHETGDGSGYPAGLTGEQILVEARLVSICEHYVALVGSRSYRKSLITTQALRHLYERAGHDESASLYLAFIKELSVYPPGTFVTLENGEVAVVTHRSKKGLEPQAKAVLNPSGAPYMGALYRDCGDEGHRIQKPVVLKKVPPLNLPAIWGYVS